MISDICLVAGLVTITIGFALVLVPAGILAAGLSLLAIAYLNRDTDERGDGK